MRLCHLLHVTSMIKKHDPWRPKVLLISFSLSEVPKRKEDLRIFGSSTSEALALTFHSLRTAFESVYGRKAPLAAEVGQNRKVFWGWSWPSRVCRFWSLWGCSLGYRGFCSLLVFCENDRSRRTTVSQINNHQLNSRPEVDGRWLG